MWELITEYSTNGIDAKSYRAKEGKIEDFFKIGIFLEAMRIEDWYRAIV